MAKSFLLGRNATAYFNDNLNKIGGIGVGPTLEDYVQQWLDADGQGGNGNTIVAGNLTDVSLNVGSEYADGTTRETAASGFGSQIAVLKNGEITFESRYLPVDGSVTPPPYTFTAALMKAWQEFDTIALAFFDQERLDAAQIPSGDVLAISGLVSNWSVSVEIGQSLRDVQRLSVTLTIADSALWYEESITGTMP